MRFLIDYENYAEGELGEKKNLGNRRSRFFGFTFV